MDETRYAFFHGAQMDIDIDKLLQSDGDFLLQTKHLAGSKRPRIYLVIKGTKVLRTELKKSEKGDVKVGTKVFKNVKQMVDFYSKEQLAVDGEKVILKKPVPRGKFQLYHTDVRLQKKIGSGAYGTVFRGVLNRDNSVIAVKKLDSEGSDEDAINEMMKEARVMQLYDHKNIVKFHGFIVDRTPYLLVMEFCDGGAVEDKLRDAGSKITINMRVDMCAQAATGLEYLHSKECIHRDIATRNCLMDKGIVKMADFGMCRPTSVYKVDLSKPLNVRWLAPEVWKIGETRYNTDIYAFALLLWEMFVNPYDSPYGAWKAFRVKQEVIKGYRMPPPEGMPDELAEVMSLAWHHEPEKRPDASHVRKMIDEINKKINPNGITLNRKKRSRG